MIRVAAILLTSVAVASCRSAAGVAGPQILQPGAPGQPGRVIAVEQAVDLSGVQSTAADVRFMQGMIGHHAQAVEMAALVPERVRAPASAGGGSAPQADISMMQAGWDRGQPPDPHAHHAPGAPDAGHADRWRDGSLRRRRATSSIACSSRG
jgi:uncharacterized protein (DUF305 family)